MFAFAPITQTLPKLVTKFVKNVKLLDEIGYTDFDVVSDDVGTLETNGKIAWLREIEFDLPGLDFASVALLSGNGMTEVAFSHRRRPDFEFRLFNLDAALRLKTDLLQRVRQNNDGKWIPELDAKGAPKPAEIVVSGAEVVMTADSDISIIGAPTMTLPAVALGETGIVLEITELEIYLSAKQTPPTGAPPGFKGVAIKKATMHFTRDFGGATPTGATCTDLLIGSSGFSGRVEAYWTVTYG
ncbi:MAG: hypothetical protein V7609_3131 [Verrucomicrobiota bacterium]